MEAVANPCPGSPRPLGTSALYPGHPQVLTAGWQHRHRQPRAQHRSPSGPGDLLMSPSRDRAPRGLPQPWCQLPPPQEPTCNEECSNRPVQMGLGRTALLSSHSQVPTGKRIQDFLGQRGQGATLLPPQVWYWKTTALGLILSLTTAYAISSIIAELNFNQFQSFKHRAREVHHFS